MNGEDSLHRGNIAALVLQEKHVSSASNLLLETPGALAQPAIAERPQWLSCTSRLETLFHFPGRVFCPGPSLSLLLLRQAVESV